MAAKAGTALNFPIMVRVVPVNYLAVVLLFSFIGAFFLYLEWDIAAMVLLLATFTIVPFLIFQDRIVFDGKRVRRSGYLYRLGCSLFSVRDRIKVSDIDQVQTIVVRAIKRGGNILYTYRTTFSGKGASFVVTSGSRNYREFLSSVLPLLNESVLDRRSADLRDHLAERSIVREKASAAELPPADILESVLLDQSGRKAARVREGDMTGLGDKATYLHELGNQLRVIGDLPQALEAFRRAVLLMPKNAQLLFDYAMCLNSYAGYRKDRSVERSARAMMRLAEKRAGDDGHLLTAIGEGYFQLGEWRRAAGVFKKAFERAGDRFRSMVGLAEVALHDGKIAHVILNFAAARDAAETGSLRNWANREIKYFSRLNEDDEYMELEISRMNLLDTLDSVKRSCLKIAVIGIPVIVLGLLAEDGMIANVGWAVSLISLVIWLGAIVLSHMLSARIPFDLAGEKH